MADRAENAPGVPDWVERLAANGPGLALVSALESTVLPIPLEALLIPLMIRAPRNALPLALWALAGCLAGSLLLFAAGALLADPVVRPVLAAFGLTDAFEETTRQLEGSSLFWAIALVSLSPAPIQMASLGAGVIGGSVWVFAAATLASRGLRYVGLALLALWLGPRLQRLRIPAWAFIAAAVALAVLLALP